MSDEKLKARAEEVAYELDRVSISTAEDAARVIRDLLIEILSLEEQIGLLEIKVDEIREAVRTLTEL